MSNTGFIEFTSISQTAADVSWTNLTNMLSGSGTYAEANLDDSQFSYIAKPVNASASLASAIPDGSTINGVIIRLEATTEDGGVSEAVDNLVQLIIGGTQNGSNKAVGSEFGDGSIATRDYGSASDLWSVTSGSGVGGSLARADLIATNFGVAIQFECPGADFTLVRVYRVLIDVYYTYIPPAPDSEADGAITTEPLTMDATAVLLRTAVSDITNPSIELSATARRTLAAISAMALEALLLSGSGGILWAADAAIFISDGIKMDAVATIAEAALGDLTFAALDMGASGTAAKDADGAITFAAFELDGGVDVSYGAVGAITLGALQLFAAAYGPYVGALSEVEWLPITIGSVSVIYRSSDSALSFSPAALGAEGESSTPNKTGTATLSFPGVELSAESTSIEPNPTHTADSAAALPTFSLDSSATMARISSGTLSLTVPALVASGFSMTPKEADGALTFAGASLSATTLFGLSSTSALVLEALTLTSTAERTSNTAAAVVLPAVVLSSVGTRSVLSAAAIGIAQSVQIAGVARLASFHATSGLALIPFTLASAGVRSVQFDSAIEVASLVLTAAPSTTRLVASAMSFEPFEVHSRVGGTAVFTEGAAYRVTAITFTEDGIGKTLTLEAVERPTVTNV